jgi:CxxC-x17-CxxC domain-containing protein
MYQDKTITCQDCGQEFTFTAGEQEFFATHNFDTEPTRCPECRKLKKQARRAPKTFHTTVCSECGKEAVVPFVPTNDKPVYCDACFRAKSGRF